MLSPRLGAVLLAPVELALWICRTAKIWASVQPGGTSVTYAILPSFVAMGAVPPR